jgi:hypothetical protein
MRKAALCLLVAATVLAGCSSAPPANAPPSSNDVQFQSPVLQLSLPTMPRDPPAAGERTLDKAPQWRLGEWWTYSLKDGFTGETHEFTRVVAGEDKAAGTYLVGFPIEGFSNDIMLFHTPGFGDIQKSDLSYETHDKQFQALQFPLTDGATWDAEFEGRGKGPAVVAVQDGKADISIAATGYTIEAVYDPELGEISHMSLNNGTYATYDVVSHGYNFKGVVRVPHAHDLIFNHGRIAGVVDVGQKLVPPSPKATTEFVDIPEGYDRASFIIALGAGPFLGVDSKVPTGVFRETVTAPDGTKYELTLLPSEGGFKLQAYGHENPTGRWTLEHVAGGVGVAFVEGIGYHSIDVDLPSGCVINSVNAQHHGAACKINMDQAGKIAVSSSTSTTG